MSAAVRVIKEKGYSKEVLDILDELRKRAETGEIIEIVCAFSTSGKTYEMVYTGCDDLMTLVGHLEKMKWRMLERSKE